MGRGKSNSHHPRKDRNRKSKGRMSYLRRVRTECGGGGASGAKQDEHGQMYGDYVPAYDGSGSKYSGRNYGGRGRGGGGSLKSGMKGFLCTTNFKENECVREAFNILNEYYEDEPLEKDGSDKKDANEQNSNLQSCIPDEQVPVTKAEEMGVVEEDKVKSDAENPVKQPTNEEEDVDIDEALTNELKNLRSEKTVRKFQKADTGVKNVVFISTIIENPSELAYRIFEDVYTKKQAKSRFLLRFLPIELVCSAQQMEEVKSKAKEVIEKLIPAGYVSFRVVVNVRLNGKLQKDEFIKLLAELVSQVNPLSFVDLNKPQYTIVAEILKTTLCLGIVKDFIKFKKYNLLEAGSNQVPADTVPETSNAHAADSSSEVPKNEDVDDGSAPSAPVELVE